MSIQTRCPACDTPYALADELAGKKARCKKCGQSFVITSVPPEPEIGFEMVKDSKTVPAEHSGATPPPASTEAPSFRAKRFKKKKRERQSSAGNRKTVVIAAAVLALGLVMLGVGLIFLRGPKQPNLVGRWKGAPEVRKAIKDVAQKENVNPLASGFAQAFVQMAADKLLSMGIDFKKSGTVFFSGNTESIGVPAESDGSWELIRAEEDLLIVRMGPTGKMFEARLAFRDKDTFTLTRLDKPDQPPITFERFRE